MKNKQKPKIFLRKDLVKTLIYMKFIVIFSFLTTIQIYGIAYSQEGRISVNLSDASLTDVFSEIESKTQFKFLYNNKILDLNQKVSLREKDKTVDEILGNLFKEAKCTYTILENNLIVIVPLKSQQDEIRITGKVTSAIDNSGIPGVTVFVKGSDRNGTITDGEGNYSILVPSTDAVLTFSSLGYNTEEISVGTNKNIDIILIESIESLDEIIVVGYGTQKKSDLTGAVMKLEADDLPSVSVSNPVQSLQGRISGVTVMTDNQPGSSPTLRIRGNGSINAGNDPLYVVDGFPLMDANINDINVNDIESFEILKDASSSAIYGSRGANGVVLITTKSGKKGFNDVSVSSYFGFQSPERLPETLNHDEFVDFINKAYQYSSGSPVYDEANPAPGYETDWQDEIIKDRAGIREHSVTFSGGNEKTVYLLSGNIFSQEGLLDASGYDKYSLRTNLSHEFKPWLTIGTHLQLSRTDQDIRDNATGDIFRFGWTTFPVKDANDQWYYANQDSKYSSYIEGTFNPVADGTEIIDNLVNDRVLGDVYAEFKLHKNLTFKTNFGVDISNGKEYKYSSTTSSSGINNKGNGEGGQTYHKKISKLTENILTYTSDFNDLHRLTLTGVYSYQDYSFEDMSTYGSGFTNDEIGANNMSLASVESIDYSSDKYSNKLASLTARGSYAYNDKYIATVTARYDGSSRFGENNKWGFFPSVGLAWRINKESFLTDVKQISNFKIRASYGVTGNQEIGNYNSLQQLESIYYTDGTSLILGFTPQIGNPDLKWERTTQVDVGIDLGLWNRVNLNFDYYTRTTTDLLFNVPIATTSGYSSMYQNVGEVFNKGFELTANIRVIDREFKWDISGNLSKNNNEIKELYGDVESINLGTYSAGFAKYLKVGEPVSGFWMRESAGIIKTQEQLTAYQAINSTAQLGEEMYVDHNGDNSISTEDYICVGSTEPDFNYGFSTSFEFKGFQLELYGQGALNYSSVAAIAVTSDYGVGYSSSTSSYLLYGENQVLNSNYIPTKYAYDRMWSEDNPDGDFPRAGAQGVYLSDRTNAGWKYFVLKNIKLSYNLKSSELSKEWKWLKGATVYVNAQNYFNYANHRGYNPENGDVSYPWAKAIIFGFNTKF